MLGCEDGVNFLCLGLNKKMLNNNEVSKRPPPPPLQFGYERLAFEDGSPKRLSSKLFNLILKAVLC